MLSRFIKKLFGSKKVDLKLLTHYLIKCAKAYSYVETLGKYADSLHIYVKEGYEVDFKREFEREVRLAIKKLRIVRAEIAFDITYEPFYGKTRNLHIFNTSSDKKYDGEFHFMTCSLINKGTPIPLMALPVRLGSQTKLAIELVDYCKHLFKNRIKCCLFDRGFYRGELIDFLKSKKINYLMFTPKHGNILKKYIEETDDFSVNNHQMKYSKEKSCWKPKTDIVVCKNIDGFDWLFATNLKFDTALDYVKRYKRRWQIETNYRVQDEARIKSKSAHYLIRYFYFLVSSLLQVYWIIHKKHNYYVPFKKFIDEIEQKTLFEYLKITTI